METDTFTEIACVVDQSGSMYKVKDDAIGGFNEFLDEQLEVDGRANLTLTLFNHDFEMVYDSEPIESVEPLDDSTFRPKGMTAMFDAVGTTIDRIDEHIDASDLEEVPDRVLVLILTDGKENASKEYDRVEIAKLIERHDERDNWEFVFWGANIDASRVADSISIGPENVSQFSTTGENVSAVFGEMSRLTQSFRETGNLHDTDDPDT